jgi:hypothetical protein
MKGFTQIEPGVIHMKRLSFEVIGMDGLMGDLQQHEGLATPTVTAIVSLQELRSVGVISELQPQSAIRGGEA